MAGGLNPIQALLILVAALVAVYLEPLKQLGLEKYSPQIIARQLSLRPTVIDTTREITYSGSYSNLNPSIEHFQNIFYAKEPSGKRRFAPPVPIDYPKGSVIDATQPGAWCPQATGDILPFTSRVVNTSENCLSLRIARPRSTRQDAKLPVVVYIHGGGHALGSASDILYTPDGLVDQAVADGQPLIWVAFNYRLGFFGFATSKAMIEAKHTNAGLRDQRAALEWVQHNIEAFGGDRDKVTVIGQSVGASDIGLQLTAFGGGESVPFQQAVMMSGAPGLNFNTKSNLVAENTAEIAKQVGCMINDDQSIETLRCLQEADVHDLTNLSVSASRAARPPFGEGFFYPTYDGDIIQDRPSELMRKGKFTKGIPIIASWVTNDGAWYAPPSTSTNKEVLESFGLWLFNLSDKTKSKLLELYPIKDFMHMVEPNASISAQYYRAAQINKDIWFTCPVLDFVWHYAKHGGAELSQIWLYEHNSTRYAPVFENMGVQMWRVAHLSDIPYILNIRHLEGGADNSPAQLELGKNLSQTIARFVSSRSPEGNNGETEAGSWPAAFSGTKKQELSQDFPSRLSLRVNGGPYGIAAVTVGKGGRASTALEEAIDWEKLFSRCEFINSAQMREETGV